MIIAALAVSIFYLSGPLRADDIKERMQARLSQIADLKGRGVVGENNQGYLEFLPGKREKDDLVSAENSDRRKVYEDIAQKTGTTADLVGRRRALQIAENAKTGEWLQKDQGKWYKK
jgi:uncharacterized protein YdbL (DUF1318 family)